MRSEGLDFGLLWRSYIKIQNTDKPYQIAYRFSSTTFSLNGQLELFLANRVNAYPWAIWHSTVFWAHFQRDEKHAISVCSNFGQLQLNVLKTVSIKIVANLKVLIFQFYTKLYAKKLTLNVAQIRYYFYIVLGFSYFCGSRKMAL